MSIDLSSFSTSEAEMKLMFVVVNYNDADAVVQALVDNNFRVTRVASTGGFMRRGNVTLMIGVEEMMVQVVIDLLHQVCFRPPEDSQHRATIFVVDMPVFEQI
jgi:uncharacterized protein YaaQ